MSWASQQGNDLNVNTLTTAGNNTLGGTTSITNLQVSGGSNIGANIQLNGSSSSNSPYIDMSTYGGNGDYDVRMMAYKGSSTTSSGQGKLTITAAAGVYINGTKVGGSSSAAPMPASAGSTVSGEMSNATCSPSNNAHTYTVSNTAPCFGVLLCNSNTYTRLISNPTSEQAFTEPENEDEEPVEYTKYTWTVSLKGSGSDPQPNVGNLSFVIF